MARGSVGTSAHLVRIGKPRKKFSGCKTCKCNKYGTCSAAYNQYVKKCKYQTSKYK